MYKFLIGRKVDHELSTLPRGAYFCFRPLSGDLGLLFRDFRPGAGGEVKQLRRLCLFQRFQQRRLVLLQIGQPALPRSGRRQKQRLTGSFTTLSFRAELLRGSLPPRDCGSIHTLPF